MITTVKSTIETRKDLTKLIDELGLKVGVEIGVNEGAFSEHLLKNSKLDKLYSIDSWTDDTQRTMSVFKKWAIRNGEIEKAEQKAREVLSAYGDRSQVIKGVSFEAVDDFKDNSVDFVFFDGCHRFSGFSLDLVKWWPKVRSGGVLSGHDYWRCYRYEVMDAANAFLVEHRLFLHLTREDKNHKGKDFCPPSFWTVKEDMTKTEYFDGLPAVKSQLLSDKKRLKEKGVDIVLPYQYFEAFQEDTDDNQ
jgi:hypothetical protein